MSKEKQLSNVSKELGCTIMKLTRRNYCRNLLRNTAEEFLTAEDKIQVWSGVFDPADPRWREGKAKEEILKNHESISTESTPAKQLQDSYEGKDQTTEEPPIKWEKKGVTIV